MTTSVVVLGSTGSIGRQALDVIQRNPELFKVVGLAAGGANLSTLADQAQVFEVNAVAVGGTTPTTDIGLRPSCRVYSGQSAACELIEDTPADIVLNAMPGSRGLAATMTTLRTGARLALANKESLVAGGSIVLNAAEPGQIIPVDSEHSAMAQCLRSGQKHEVERLVLTASGGPFRGWNAEQLHAVTVDQALNHPKWTMGKLVTVNSSTLVNKGLELIEAHLLFDLPYDRIDVVVHPQSVIHSMATFSDGSTIAQASPPDMRLPIAVALAWPNRINSGAEPCTWTSSASWTFEPLDHQTFPAVELARAVGTAGGCLPAIYNAGNEELVTRFLTGQVPYPTIVETIRALIDESGSWLEEPSEIADVFAAEAWARIRAGEILSRRRATASF